jgi:hypothetical protein
MNLRWKSIAFLSDHMIPGIREQGIPTCVLHYKLPCSKLSPVHVLQNESGD